ncbi:MAG: hypothetical protein J5994_10915 [Ruminococcus sp.]|nr:hypothetical protein [Ruminococcus sp.]
MLIKLKQSYYADVSETVIGYVGETNARTITFSGLETDSAQAYKMRLKYPDGVVYDVDITGGKYTVDGSVLRMPCNVHAQIFAYAAEGETYTIVKKSQIFTLAIKESLDDEPAPIPTYEQSLDALEKVLSAEIRAQECIEVAQSAKADTESAQKSAETARNAAQLAAQSAEESYAGADRSAQNAAQSALTAEESADIAKKSEQAVLSAKSEIDSVAEEISAAAQEISQTAERVAADKTAAETAKDIAVEKSREISGSAEQIRRNTDDIAELKSDVGLVHDLLGGVAVESWADVQKIVRAGQAAKYFSVGDQLVCEKAKSDGTSERLVWDVIGIDHDTPSDPQFTHSLTLQLHELYQNMQFDSPEAMCYCETGLPAGTYNFTLPDGYDTEHGGGKTYSFTITKPVPAAGQIMFPWGSNQQASATKISTYVDNTTSAALEAVPVVEGSEGTYLGTADGKSANMNNVYRICYGSNNWIKSDIRMRLNSDAPKGDISWRATTKFARKPSWVKTEAGFLNGIDADFLAVLGNVKKVTARNKITDGGGSEESDELIFLLSRPEVFAGKENNIDEGVPYPYYADNSDLPSAGTGSDTNRIKYTRSGAPFYCYLRSPFPNDADRVRGVDPSGALTGLHADTILGFSPACCII